MRLLGRELERGARRVALASNGVAALPLAGLIDLVRCPHLVSNILILELKFTRSQPINLIFSLIYRDRRQDVAQEMEGN